MSGTITNLGHSGYYQLGNANGGQSQGAGAGSNVTQSLIQALEGQNATAASSSDAYLLSLSPQAQQYLNAVNSGAGTGQAVLNAINGNLTSGGAKGQGSFLLNAQQRQTIADILAKYKDAPYNQDTFNQIQDDLNAAGLGTNTLSMKDQAKSFNPLMVLVNALNGGSTSSSNTGVPGSADEQSKANNFIQGIIQQWQNLLGRGQTTSQDAGADGSGAPADGVTPVESGGGA